MENRDAPGSRSTLLCLRPLRTQRAPFAALRSSLSNARCRTRFHHLDTLAVHLPMAMGRQ